MAMKFANYGFGIAQELLNRARYEAIQVTLDFNSANSKLIKTDDAGHKYIPAGAIIVDGGKSQNEAKAVSGNIMGVNLYDVYEDRPQAAVLKKAYIKKAVMLANTGYTESGAAVTALLADNSMRFVLE